MLAYLDALIAALSLRDRAGIVRLLEHPLARIIPGEARAEAESFASGEPDPLAAPLRMMQLRHQTAELLRESVVVADRAEEPAVTRERTSAPRVTAPLSAHRPPRMMQMELPLSA
jgi:hypothetical protein